MEPRYLPKFVSDKFKFWSFISMVLLVFVHGYNLEIRYLRPWTAVYEHFTVTSFTEYFLANGIFRFRMPMLFGISGYLYAMHDATPNNQRFRKRVRTILLPYLIWSALSLIITYGLEMISYTRNIIIDSKYFWMGNSNLLLHDMNIFQLIKRWLLFPVSFQLWFLRVLVVYSLAYPAIRWCILHPIARPVYFFIVTVLWIISFDILFVEGEGLLFFSLGIWLQKKQFDIEKPGPRFNPLIWGIVFISLAILKTWFAFKGQAIMGEVVFDVLAVLHKLVGFSGLIACWYGLDFLVKRCMDKKWFIWLSAFSFIIYVLHAPIVTFSINGMLTWLHPFAAYRSMAFVLLPVTIIIFCIIVGILLRNVAPKSYRLLTGGRGL